QTGEDTCGGGTLVLESDVTTQMDCTQPGHVKYSRTKTWHAKDACGNVSAPVSQTIMVADTTPPAVLKPADQTADEGTSKNFDLGSFTDNCSDSGPYAVDVNWGDGTAHTTFNVTPQGTLGQQSHKYLDGPN